jgi:small subunit ribosomal protein S6
MFIVRPDAAEEDVDKLIAGFTANITNGGGMVKTVEKMGRRKLAYMVERRLRVTEPVIKFITVRIDEEEKRLAKVKAKRGVRRTATPIVSAPAPVAAPAPAAAPVPVAAEAPVVVPAPVAAAAAEPVQAV